jgi:DNA polymerase-3 subunit epsilon
MHPSPPTPIPWHLLPGPLVLIDLETTGVSPTADRVVEIAAVRHEPGRPPRVFESLIDPDGRGPGPTHVHGITREMLRGAPRFAAVIAPLRELCTGAIMVAHNASFEDRFLAAELARLGGSWGLPRLCTLLLARRLHPERKGGVGHKLGGLVETYGLTVKDSHAAMGDVRMMSALLGAMLRTHAEDPKLPRLLAASTRVSDREIRWPSETSGAALRPRSRALP